jgi:eukaryotic-like serine/threonine-protein kinase
MKPTPVGEKLDRFELVAELASGGMATVYLARLGGIAGFQRLVAIKRLHPHLAREAEFVNMFLDEARLAARIHHPNVVPILEIGQSQQGYFVVMDYIEGDTAARLLARSAQAGARLPAPITLRIVVDTLTGLHAAHELRDDNQHPLELVHRDVSPQNILVGVDGVARITDFGVARAATRLSSTEAGQLKGKLAYMAPEHAGGGPIDRRADVFSMGAVLWELLTARRLFKGEGEAETLTRVLFDPIPSPRQFEPSLPPGIEQVCMRALTRDTRARFASAWDMADALERVARPLQFLASARDVATFIEAVMGKEVSQRRETVRAWIAQSESGRSDRPPEAALDIPGAASETADLVSPRASTPPSTVTGVSSAVVETERSHPNAFRSAPPPRPSGGAPRAEASSRRGSRIVWVGIVTLLIATGFALTRPYGLSLLGGKIGVAPPVAPGAPTASTLASAAPETSVSAPLASPPAEDSHTTRSSVPVETPPLPSTSSASLPSHEPPATASSAPIGPSPPPNRPSRPGARVPPAAVRSNANKPLAPSPALDEPDDISKNPYR